MLFEHKVETNNHNTSIIVRLKEIAFYKFAMIFSFDASNLN